MVGGECGVRERVVGRPSIDSRKLERTPARASSSRKRSWRDVFR